MPAISKSPTEPEGASSIPPNVANAAALNADDAETTASAFWRGPIDLLPVSLFRLALGVVLFLDTLEILPNLRLYYSDEGIWPRHLAPTARAPFSLYWLFGSPGAVYALYGATLLSMISLALGYRTRIASVTTFVLLTSLHARFPFALDSSDSVARLCLFFLCFCSSGHRVSLDALRAARKGAPLSTHGHALPVRLLQAQIGAVYYATASWKLLGPAWRDGTALHYALSIPHMFSRPWALALANVPWFVRIGTWSTLAVELAILLSIFSPWRRREAKAVAIISGLLLHATIALTMSVGLFTFLMPVTYLALLEPTWAHALWRRIRRLGPSMHAESSRSTAVEMKPTSTAVRAVLFAFFVLIQVASSPWRERLPAPLAWVVDRASLWGAWRMFAPYPPRADVRLRGDAIFPDGTRVHLFEGVEGNFGAARGLKFSRRWKVEEALSGSQPSLQRGFAEWRCRQGAHLGSGAPAPEDSFRFELILESWSIAPLGDAAAHDAKPPDTRVLLRGECEAKKLLSLK